VQQKGKQPMYQEQASIVYTTSQPIQKAKITNYHMSILNRLGSMSFQMEQGHYHKLFS